jgi:hypothetical protein
MTEIAALFAKWLTHDLATPAATVMTASELLGPVGDAEVNHLVQDGARRLVARLRLIRTAFASGGGPLAAHALERLVRDGLDGTPVDWQYHAESSGGEAALVAAAALMLADLARGSPLTVASDGVRWATPRAMPEASALALAGGTPADGRAAIAALVAAAARQAGRSIVVTADGVNWS